jgi:hypothetical protein
VGWEAERLKQGKGKITTVETLYLLRYTTSKLKNL